MPRQPQRLARQRGEHRRAVADGEYPVHGPVASRLADRLEERRVGIVLEADRDRPIAPRVVQLVTPVGREDQLDTQPFGRLTERAGLVPGRCRDQQHSRHR